MTATLLLSLFVAACPVDEAPTTSATRALDLGEVGLLRSHFAVAVPREAPAGLATRLRALGFAETPRAPWRVFYQAAGPEDAVRLLAKLDTVDAATLEPSGFAFALDGILHEDQLEPTGLIASSPPAGTPIGSPVVARLGARSPELTAAILRIVEGDPKLVPRAPKPPKRKPRPRILLLDRTGDADARVGLVLTSTTPWGEPVMEGVAIMIGDGPMSRLGRLLRADLSEASLTSLAVGDVGQDGFALSARTTTDEIPAFMRALPSLLDQLRGSGLGEKEREVARRRARGYRALASATPRGRLEQRLLDHVRRGRSRLPSDFDCLTAAELAAAARSVGGVTGLRIVVEGNIPPGLAAELARRWPTSEIELRRLP